MTEASRMDVWKGQSNIYARLIWKLVMAVPLFAQLGVVLWKELEWKSDLCACRLKSTCQLAKGFS